MQPLSYRTQVEARSQFVTVRGLRYHVTQWGTASIERPPLVLLHGWMDVGASFQFCVDAMADQRWVIAPDWRGFGRSDSPAADSYWFPDYLGDLEALLDVLAPDQAVDLVGHSMGGNVAMLYAGVRPKRVRRLVNMEGFGMPDATPEQAPTRYAQWLEDIKTPQRLRDYASLPEVADRLMKNNPRLSAQRAAWLAPHWARESGDGRWHIQGDPAHKRIYPVLYRKAEAVACWRAIEAPVLWLEGAQTDVARFWGNRFPRSDFDERIAVVRKLQSRVIDNAGHMVHHDQPQHVAQAIEAFLRS